jgi:hypothetical protein
MTKASSSSISSFLAKPKIKRKGVHSKCKTSKNKRSKHYKKLSVGQG